MMCVCLQRNSVIIQKYKIMYENGSSIEAY